MGSSVSSISSIWDPSASATPANAVADQTNVQNQINRSAANADAYNKQQQSQQQSANQFTSGAATGIGTSQSAIDTANAAATGGYTSDSMNLLQQQANGTAPTAATGILQQGTDQAIQSQQAMANSGNTSQMISGQKTAMDNAASIQGQNANSAAQVAANQQMAGSQNYANAAATQNSQLATNAGLQQNQVAQQTALANMQNQSALGYAGAGNTAQGQALTGQTNALNIQQGAYNQNAQNQANASAGMMNAAGAAGVALAASSSIHQKYDVNYASGDDQGEPFVQDKPNSSIGLSGPKSSGSSQPSSSSDKPESSFGDKYAEASKTKYFDTNAKPVASPQLIPLESDKNAKKGIHGDHSIIRSFLDALDPVTFKYKVTDGKMGKTPGEHIGVIAQQLEKAPGGRSMVIDTPQGKAIDIPSAVGTLLAAVADMNSRMDEVQHYFKSKKKGSK